MDGLYGTVHTGDFYDDSVFAEAAIPGSLPAEEEVLIPLAEVFTGGKDQLTNGILI
jgi:hypothetical protein